jgi:predicted Zn-dependent protease with MMP-like domain
MVYKKARQKAHFMISFEEFTQLVAEALDTLPAEIAEKMDNVAVTVEEKASPTTLAGLGIRDPSQLFGLYHGVPRPQRSVFAPLPAFPDKIEIYFRPIARACRTPQEMKELVRRVVVHEIGHHFGMSDKQLRALGY